MPERRAWPVLAYAEAPAVRRAVDEVGGGEPAAQRRESWHLERLTPGARRLGHQERVLATAGGVEGGRGLGADLACEA